MFTSEENLSSFSQEIFSNRLPSINLVFQYVKDLSVENPSIYALLSAQEKEVETEFSVDVQAQRFEDQENQVFEVTLFLKVEIQKEGKKGFLLELRYAGVFNIGEAEEEALRRAVFVQCPQLLFPSARHVLRSMAQESGLPTMNIQPIDFQEIFERQSQTA